MYKLYAFLLRWFRCLTSLGFKYQCPFCLWGFRRWLPAGNPNWQGVVGGGLRDCLCPRCHSTDKERLLFIYIQNWDFNQPLKSCKILHIAPEKRLSDWIKQWPEYEYHAGSLDRGEKIDIRKIEYPDNYFDLIICSHVLEHVEEDRVAMKELYRVLKPGGEAILQVPLSENMETQEGAPPEDWERLYGQKGHVRLYGQDYFQRLEESGFKVSQVEIRIFLIGYRVASYVATKELCSSGFTYNVKGRYCESTDESEVYGLSKEKVIVGRK